MGQLVVSCGDAPEVLDAAEGILDPMTLSVAPFVIADLAFAIGAARNDGNRPLGAQGCAQFVCIIALVGDEVAHRAKPFDEMISSRDVRDIAGGQGEGIGTAQNVCQGMDLCRLPAARGADGLRFRPPLPPKAERCALT